MSTKTLIDENVKPSTTILTLAWPVFIEQVLSTLVYAVDAAMVGSLGAVATASVSISGTPMMLINGIIMSFGMGFTALIARKVGARDFEGARSLIRQALTTVVIMGIPLAILSYMLSEPIPRWMGAEPDVLVLAAAYNKIIALGMFARVLTMLLTSIYRGYGDTKTPMIINTAVNVANVFGNYLLIYPTHDVTVFGNTFTIWGAGWGVQGAAASTTGTVIIGALVILGLTFFRKSDLKISLNENFRLIKSDMISVTKVGLPMLFERVTMGTAAIIIATIVASLGTIAIASNSLSGQIESFCFMPGFAFSAASTTLVGQSLGAKRVDMAENYVRTTIKIAALTMLVASSFMFVFSSNLIVLFTRDKEVIKIGGELVKILAVIQVPFVISMIHGGALRGAGDTKSSFYITLISMWGVRVLGSLICVKLFGFGIHSVVICMSTDNVFRALLFWLRYRQGGWKTIRI